VALDDADGRILYARFFTQEGTASTFAALESVLRNYGRFCELYTDRGSHFCQSGPAGEVAEEQHGQVSQALRALGIKQILARSPQARGRSERAFGTIQGRLPQELRHQGITDYGAANRYLEQQFVADFNRRFTVKPAQPESAFVKLAGIELELVLSSKHERIVRNDNTITFKNLILQLPTTRHRIHFVRCPVTVHQFANGTLGISYQGRLLATMPQAGPSSPAPIRSAPPIRNAWPAQLSSALQRTGGRESRIHIFPPTLQWRVRVRAEKCCYHSPQSQPKEVTPNMSAINKTTIFKRTSLIVYEADIFNCSQQRLIVR
jgi:hypothetical protein